MDKKEFIDEKQKEAADAFDGVDIGSLFEPLPSNPEFKKLIIGCPLCGEDPLFYDSENNLLMNGAWNIVCEGCDLRMRENFILGKGKKKAETVILKRWNKRIKDC